MQCYYDKSTSLPVMHGDRPMLTSETIDIVNRKNLLSWVFDDKQHRLSRWGYTADEYKHFSKEQIDASEKFARGEYYKEDFKHKVWNEAKESGASNSSAIVIALGSYDKVTAGLRNVDAVTRNYCLNNILNPLNTQFQKVRALIDSHSDAEIYKKELELTKGGVNKDNIAQSDVQTTQGHKPVLFAEQSYKQKEVVGDKKSEDEANIGKISARPNF